MQQREITTYQKVFLDIRRQFWRAGYPGADLEARELICAASGKSREEFYRDRALYLSPETEDAVRALARRHLDGEPVAYLIGEWEFYGLPLDISQDVLIPRADTEVLAEQAIAYIQTLGECRVLDLCAGSGCVGLAVASQAPKARVALAAAANVSGCRALLGDVSQEALTVCRRNVRRCGLTDRVKAETLDALALPPPFTGAFDCITCNPPYIPRADLETLDRPVKDFEPLLALCGGEDGLDFYRAAAKNWKNVLTENGRMYFEVGIGQAEEVWRLMDGEGFLDIRVLPDTQGIDRVVYGTFRRGAIL